MRIQCGVKTCLLHEKRQSCYSSLMWVRKDPLERKTGSQMKWQRQLEPSEEDKHRHMIIKDKTTISQVADLDK